MRIRRLQVDGGFLRGLDLEFLPGMNVLIGSRGVGKTSVIELIRFCLGVEAFTKGVQAAADDHARSVLGDGQVTITLSVGAEELVIERSGDAAYRRVSGVADFRSPIVLSQREIEQIGRDEGGRLRLIDDFVPSDRQATSGEDRILGLVASISLEIAEASQTIDSLSDRLDTLQGVTALLEAAEVQQREFLVTVESHNAEQAELKVLAEEMAAAQARDSDLKLLERGLSEMLASFDAVVAAVPDVGARSGSPIPQESGRVIASHISEVLRLVDLARTALKGAQAELSAVAEAEESKNTRAAARARELRGVLEEVKKGAGEITKRVSDLRKKAAAADLIGVEIDGKKDRLDSLSERRGQLLEELEAVRSQRYDARLSVVTRLNDQLEPKIDIGLTRLGQRDDYVRAIKDALQGSRLHYNVLGAKMAESFSPRELARIVESGDVEQLSEVVGSEERAVRVIAALRENSIARILTADVEDVVEFRLLDGTDFKNSALLSTGQRCTVVLPVLLEHEDRVIILDQPEDHLDNSFIVDTVVKSMRDRSDSSQLILATHNANIPVIGGASQVIVLDSDGTRGFVRSVAPLDDLETVDAITSIMEGGVEAFEKRAAFYRDSLTRG